MKKSTLFFTLFFVSLRLLAQEDAENCKDHPMFNRMPNMFISQCSQNYDQVDVPFTQTKSETKEGNKTFIEYVYNTESGVPAPSFFQIVKNFENAVIKKGGKKIGYDKDAGFGTFFIKSGNKDVWIVLNDFSGTSEGNFQLTLL